MTIAGMHTISETKDLQAQMEWRIDGLNDALAKVKRESPHAIDADPTLVSDWDAFLARWVGAKGWVKTKYAAALIANPLVGPDIIPSEDAYQKLVHAGSLTAPLYTNTDLPGLSQRITKVGGVFDGGPMPKGYAIDLDLKGYKASDTGVKIVQGAATDIVAAKDKVIADNKGTILFTIGAVGVGLYLANRYKLI